jgi:phospholipid-transporting ATPase
VSRNYFQGEQSEQFKKFFSFLALCHKIVVDTSGKTIKYQSASPDETALVMAASDHNIVLKNVTKATYCVDILGTEVEYELVKEFSFNSHRR